MARPCPNSEPKALISTQGSTGGVLKYNKAVVWALPQLVLIYRLATKLLPPSYLGEICRMVSCSLFAISLFLLSHLSIPGDSNTISRLRICAFQCCVSKECVFSVTI